MKLLEVDWIKKRVKKLIPSSQPQVLPVEKREFLAESLRNGCSPVKPEVLPVEDSQPQVLPVEKREFLAESFDRDFSSVLPVFLPVEPSLPVVLPVEEAFV